MTHIGLLPYSLTATSKYTFRHTYRCCVMGTRPAHLSGHQLSRPAHHMHAPFCASSTCIHSPGTKHGCSHVHMDLEECVHSRGGLVTGCWSSGTFFLHGRGESEFLWVGGSELLQGGTPKSGVFPQGDEERFEGSLASWHSLSILANLATGPPAQHTAGAGLRPAEPPVLSAEAL